MVVQSTLVKMACIFDESLLMHWCSYTKSSKDVIAQLDGLDAFKKISKAVETSIEAHKDISGSDIASMYGGLIQFAEAVYPDRLVYVDNILEQAVKVIAIFLYRLSIVLHSVASNTS